MIDPSNYGLVEIAVTGVIVLGLATWQLLSVNREVAKDRARRHGSPEDARHSIGEHRLDDR